MNGEALTVTVSSSLWINDFVGKAEAESFVVRSTGCRALLMCDSEKVGSMEVMGIKEQHVWRECDVSRGCNASISEEVSSRSRCYSHRCGIWR